MIDLLKRRWWRFVGLFVLLAVGGFVTWASIAPTPMPQAIAALESDRTVQVEREGWLVFRPAGQMPETGLIFYPGGRVDPRSYAPLAREIAGQGYLVVVVPMPLHLAVLGSQRADAVIQRYDQVQRWAIGGHSLGGAMAAQFAADHPERIAGLVLWAAYPAASNDLSSSSLRVTSIYGTVDGVATADEIDASRALLPETTEWVPIEGGNHAQFGWYGSQRGDNEAQIGRQQQQAQIVDATCALLGAIANATKPGF
jgi:dienelactone hydrolase